MTFVQSRPGRSAYVVWACLTDWERAQEWMGGIDEIRPADGATPGEGARVLERDVPREREEPCPETTTA